MIEATAPGRCGIVGNPSDMYGGAVLSVTTRERARCVIAPGTELAIAAGGLRAAVRGEDDLAPRGDALDIARAVLRHFRVRPYREHIELTLTTDIPMKAGMAGSTALVVAAVGALARHLRVALHPWAVAEAARLVEARIMGVLCGFQDQHMAVFGGLNLMDFAGKESLEQRADEPLATIEPLATWAPRVPLLAAHTGVEHHSGTVHRSPRERWLEGEPLVVDSYERIAALARPAKRALLDSQWERLGALMNENHALVADLGGSGPENERLIGAARRSGAWGAKLAGAGGGGTVLVLAEDLEGTAAALRQAGAERILVPEPGPGLIVGAREAPAP